MKRFRQLLVGVDFDAESGALTEGSGVAAQQALWLAGLTGARVDFLHSAHRNPEDGPLLRDGPPEVGRAMLDEIVRRADASPADLLLSEEPAWIALTRRVLAGDNDFVVVAKRNRSKLQDRRLGSVSLKLVRKCPSPVWVVKPGHEPRHRSVLAATDLTSVGDLATEYGAFIADAEGCGLAVVHAWQLPMELQMSRSRMSREDYARRLAEISVAARDHIRAVPPVAALGKSVDVYLSCDAPSHAILEAVERTQPDLVVMGTIARGGVAGVLVGNTAEKLLHRLDCSLLAVKPADFVCPLQLERDGG